MSDRAPSSEWIMDRTTHARLSIGDVVADVWQVPDDEGAWIWAVNDGDCYVRLHETMADAQIAAEDAARRVVLGPIDDESGA